MSKYAQGIFTPQHPEKYVGRGSIKFRSSWEYSFMKMCDGHPGVLQWASESIRVPYINPLTGKSSIYVPDFFVVYQDKNGRNHAELVEVKPSKETTFENARSQRDKLMVAINMAKWQAAMAFCQKHGMKFRIVTENDLWHTGR
jgi:hypothetical protein